LKESETNSFNRIIDALGIGSSSMAERFLPTEDPVMESVLQWTVERDAKDVRRLLEWLPEARSSRERKALMERVRSLLEELEDAMNKLDELR
tara:strand:+ start:862 stop:1137 length:276 start_codon:yes stop_codon:yes gene_type:complete